MGSQIFRLIGAFKGGGGSNALYITRKEAVKEQGRGISTRNIPLEVTESGSYGELRINLSNYVRASEEDELARPRACSSAITKKTDVPTEPGKTGPIKKPAGGRLPKDRETRTNLRAVFSFDRPVEAERMHSMINECVNRTPLRNVPALIATHRDTAHPHAHVLFLTRDTEGRKVDLDWRAYRQIGDIWNELYSREFGLDPQVFLAKKEEMRRYKRAALKAKSCGGPRPERPARSRFPSRETLARRAQKERWDRSKDPEWLANNRFDRELKAAEREVNKQADPFAELERRIGALRKLKNSFAGDRRWTHEADERRVGVRDAEPAGSEQAPAGRARPRTTDGGWRAAGTDRKGARGGDVEDQYAGTGAAGGQGGDQCRGEADSGGRGREWPDAGGRGVSGGGQQTGAGTVPDLAAEDVGSPGIRREECNTRPGPPADRLESATTSPVDTTGPAGADQPGRGSGDPAADTQRAVGGDGEEVAGRVTGRSTADVVGFVRTSYPAFPVTRDPNIHVIADSNDMVVQDVVGTLPRCDNLSPGLRSEHLDGAVSSGFDALADAGAKPPLSGQSLPDMLEVESSPDLAAGFRSQVESALNELEDYRQNYQQTLPPVNDVTGNVFDAEPAAEEAATVILDLLL